VVSSLGYFVNKKQTATCLIETAFKTAMYTKLTPGRFNYSIVRTSDMPGTVLGFVLSPTELKFVAVELFTVNAVKTIRPLLSCSHLTRFLFVACHVHIDLSLCLFNLSFAVLNSEIFQLIFRCFEFRNINMYFSSGSNAKPLRLF
jgi:hypothetical protein